jgi:glycosyltransferase 2 family protein
MQRIAWRRGLSTIGSLIGLALLIRQAVLGWSALPTVLASPDAIPMAGLGLLSAFLAVGMPIAAFFVLLRGTGASVTLRQVACRYTFTFLPRYIPGSVWGYLSRGEWLNQDLAVPFTVANSAAWFEAAASAATALIIAGGLLLPESLIVRAMYFFFSCVLLLIIWIGSNQISRFVHLIPAKSWWRTWLPDQPMGLSHWISALGLFGFHWALIGLALSFVIGACASPAGGALAPAVVQASELYAAAWLAGFLVLIAPAGIGIRETVLAGVLHSVAGLPLGIAAGVAILLRLLFIAAELLWTLAGKGLSFRNVAGKPAGMDRL